MARCLIIGCGCRGRLLARGLIDQGHTVRGTTREPDHRGAIELAGAEAVLADPDRVATMVEAFEHVSVACVLLGSAVGTLAQLEALHGPRLEALLTRMVDTTVHGVVYEARGTLDPRLLAQGAERVRAFSLTTRARFALLEADPAVHETWLRAALAAVGLALETGPGGELS